MKIQHTIGSLSFLSIATLLALVVPETRPAAAQCVIADVAVQTAITGSQKPAKQSNQVTMERRGSCSGNSSVSVGQQVQVGGTGQVIQQRQSHHRIEGTSRHEAGVQGPTVAIPVQVQVDVYNAADRLQQP
ncbi:hypothetical protein [Trichothermofontia sp.]